MFERIEDALGYVHDLIDTRRGDIGLEYIAYGDEKLLPRYPASVVAPGETVTAKHGTHYFMRTYFIEILVLHAAMSRTRAMRTKEDLEMTTRLTDALAEDPTCGGLAIFSYVTNESPQNVATDKNVPVVATQVSWQAESRVAFK